MSVPVYRREIPRRFRLEAGKCVKCGKIYFPTRIVCAECGSREFEKIALSREGKLLTYTVIHVGPQQFKDETPYAIGIVELKEGVRLLSQITDCDLDKMKTGMPLKIEFRKISEEGKAGVINYGYKCVPA